MRKTFKLFAVAMVMVIALSACGRGYSEGARAGVVTKFSHKGFVSKTWEGQMNLGGVTGDGDGGLIANVWNFSVTDPKVVAQIEEARKSGKRVELHYEQWVIQPPLQMDTSYEIVKVEGL